jgi:hypothetical protein
MALVLVFSTTNAQTTPSQKKAPAQSSAQKAPSFFNGAWQGNMGESKTFWVMHDGYFNNSTIDLAGKWEATEAGSYTVNSDSSITLKMLYSSQPEHVGAQNTAGYRVSGDTVTLWHLKKLVDPQGNDITDQMPKNMVETIVRMK